MNNLYDQIRLYLPITEIELKVNDQNRAEQGSEFQLEKAERIDL